MGGSFPGNEETELLFVVCKGMGGGEADRSKAHPWLDAIHLLRRCETL